ncbi:uncharacterized protein SAPINGB_P002256 [Magnusiomyces paraingens]|uniref:CAAX prenyl protease n=1 Tax=Magnusiomyces paraingens TaxID=2606893 RepID=A0A5E8BKW7_9ASCO|nr:uncharacterized protein SAPINGB_P002256 [Saprochaete ingens]VVT49409.1 unnamed protein product [Saprochaete ingens]
MDFFSKLATVAEIPGFNWKGLVVAFTAGQFAFDTYLNIRQYNFLKNDKPQTPEDGDEETFFKTQRYQLTKQRFSIFTGAYSFITNVAFLKFNVLPKLYYATGQFISTYAVKFGFLKWFASPTPQSVVTFLALQVLSSIISLPLSYYSTFVIEEKFGFNKQTKVLFFTDFLKTQVLSFAIGTPIILGFVKIIEYFGDAFFLYVWSFFFVVQIFMMTIAPIVIMPLFNKFTPLEDGSLKTKIEDLAKSLSFPLSKLFVIDGSKRSSHSNAFFTGLPWSKRIVLFDTLIEQASSDEEIVAVIGHEIGHWAKNHLAKTLVVLQGNLSLIFFLFSAFFRNKSFYESFGFDTTSPTSLFADRNNLPIIIGFILFLDILKPLEFFTTFGSNLLSRKHEYEADEYATDLGMGEDLSSGLVTLFKENKSSARSDPLYSAYHYSHPLLPERLAAIRARIESNKTAEKKDQ